MPGRARRIYPVALAFCCLLAAALRVYKLGDANPWWDEGFTYWLASQDVPGMLLRTAGDTHPPLSYLLYQLWMPLAGRAIYALRFQAVLFGILAAPVCAAAARRLGGRWAGILAALLVAISPFHVWWSQQIRMYALVALLCALSIYLLIRALQEPKPPRAVLVALFLTNVAGLYTLYFFAVLVLLEGLLAVALLAGQRRRPLLSTVYCLLSTPIPLLPWLAYFRQHAIRFPDDAAPLTWLQFLQASWAELTLGIDTGVQRYSLLLIALGFGTVLLLIMVFRRGSRLFVWLALVAFGLPLAAYAITLQRGLFFSASYQTRYDLPALPALLILLACGMAALRRPLWLAPLVLFAGSSAIGLGALYEARHRTDDYQSLARFVEAYERPGDAIVFDPDWNFHLFLLDYRGGLPWQAIPLHQKVDAAYANQVLSTWSAEYSGLWLLQESGGHDAGAEHPISDWLDSHLRPALRLQLGDRLLVLYEQPSAPPRTLNPAYEPQVALDPSTGLRGYDQPLEDVRPGDLLHLALYPVRSPLGLEVAGRPVEGAQLPGSSQFTIPITAATPAGRQPISVVEPDGRSLTIGHVQVEAGASEPAATALPPLAQPVDRVFGGLATLTSYALQPPTPRAGQDLTVQLQWRALAPFSQNYTVFVHVLDPASRVVAQRDSQPLNGQLPTLRWLPGQVLNDSYTLPLPPSLPPGEYQLELGMYLQATGQRLALEDGTDRLLIPLPIE